MGWSCCDSDRRNHSCHFPYKMILRHGCPQEIVPDQWREFCNKLVDSLEELNGFRHKITSAYNPKSNGLDERFNQMLKSNLQKLVHDHQDDWDDLLDNILFAYRSSHQDSTKCSPFLLMYGQGAHFPSWVSQGLPPPSGDDCIIVKSVTIKPQFLLRLKRKKVAQLRKGALKKALLIESPAEVAMVKYRKMLNDTHIDLANQLPNRCLQSPL